MESLGFWLGIVMFLGVLLPILAIVSFPPFVLYVISNKTIKFMYFFYANLIFLLPLCLFALLPFFDYKFKEVAFRIFNHLVDAYCVIYIGAMFFIVLREIFLNKNVRVLGCPKILIPLFMTFAFLLFKTYEIDYNFILFDIFFSVGPLVLAPVIIFPISFLSSISLLLLTKHVFQLAQKEGVYLKNEKALRVFCVFLFIVFLVFLVYLFHSSYSRSVVVGSLLFMSVFSYGFLLLYTRNIFGILGKEALYLKNIKIIGIIRMLIACIFIVIFFVYFRVSG